jgi:diadenosine tetraphosphatase ApaH/serine/threonine PP2A family protein phosphatase
LSPAALLYDVHGNLQALEAVIEDIGAAGGASSYVLGGDYAMFGPWPRETVARLRELEPARWIRGNVDRWTASPHDAPDDPVPQSAIAACREALGDELVAELGALPEQLVIDGVRYCHGSPASDVLSFLPEPAPNEDELIGGVSERMVVFGHTHLPFEREGPDGVLLVNPGSVGIPLDGDTRAAYALLHDDGRVEHRRAPYDAGASAAALRERFDGEFVEVIARRIECARFEAG